MTKQKTVDRVREILGEFSQSTPVDKASLTLLEDLNYDSLDMVELVMDLEDEFDLLISDEEAERWKTVGDVETFICQKVNAS